MTPLADHWDEYIRRRNRPIAERIKELRITFDITQEHLATLLGVSWTSVSRWEGGHRRPTPATGRLLAALERASFDPDLVMRIRRSPLRDPLTALRDVLDGVINLPAAVRTPALTRRARPQPGDARPRRPAPPG